MDGRFLITGGCGFVGRHFASQLVEAGARVVLVDPLSEGGGGLPPSEWKGRQASSVADVEWAHVDCRGYFESATADQFDAIFHLAAIVGGRLSIERQALAVAQDLAIDAAMFEWAAATGASRIVYFSSSAAYPIALQTRSDHRPLRESDVDFDHDSIGVPDLSYGWAKLTGEFLGKLASERYGINVASYRPFSGYGADQDTAYPFTSIVDRVLSHRVGDQFMVWGSGDQERDFIHVEDCVRGVLSTYLLIDDGGALNLSSGVPTTFRELANLIADVAGIDLGDVRADESKPEGVFSRVGDTSRQRSLGLQTNISLADGVREAVECRADLGRAR